MESFTGFVGPFQANDREAHLVAIARRAAPVARTGKQLIIKLPKARGFQTSADIPKETVIQPIEITKKHQRKNFIEFSRAGYNVSEVFVRYEGHTPWKRVGEVVHKTGDFREAVRCQYHHLVKRSYYLYRKFRFWYPTDKAVQFGYTDTEGNIVEVDEGPLELGVEPQEMKAMLQRSGFWGAEKPKMWGNIKKKLKNYYSSKKDHHRKKSWLTKREFNTRIEAHKWWNPRKYRGRYLEVQTRKRGLVTGTGPSR